MSSARARAPSPVSVAAWERKIVLRNNTCLVQCFVRSHGAGDKHVQHLAQKLDLSNSWPVKEVRALTGEKGEAEHTAKAEALTAVLRRTRGRDRC